MWVYSADAGYEGFAAGCGHGVVGGCILDVVDDDVDTDGASWPAETMDEKEWHGDCSAAIDVFGSGLQEIRKMCAA